jgi:glycosyltransferase involved in cell wall biosynthesis
MARVVIHATNVFGLGARTVADALLPALVRRSADVDVHLRLPDAPFWRRHAVAGSAWKVVFEARSFEAPARWLTRGRELLTQPRWLNDGDRLLVLGDIPLRHHGWQVVLLHQPHLIAPAVDGTVQGGRFRVARLAMRWNGRYADRIVVQTDVMAESFRLSYPRACSAVHVIPQPVPAWLAGAASTGPRATGSFRMIYPAAAYPHKNHRLMDGMAGLRDPLLDECTLSITLSEPEWPSLTDTGWIRFLGRLPGPAMREAYSAADAVFFPSLHESYGLPLVEAMALGLIVICADRPYARWLCEEEAVYFDPNSAESAVAAIASANDRRRSGWRPDWASALAKVPSDWDEVADEFWRELGA